MMRSFLRAVLGPPPDHMSAAWLRQQERREMRIDFHGPAWNWGYLIRKARQAEWRTRAAQRRRRRVA